jgi:hypothetical protein
MSVALQSAGFVIMHVMNYLFCYLTRFYLVMLRTSPAWGFFLFPYIIELFTISSRLMGSFVTATFM